MDSKSEKKEVDDVKEEEYMKHPLQNQWQLWYWKQEKKEWKDNLLEVTSFNTVEDFWALYNHIELVGNLQPGSDYCLFKQGIQPMWEDERNSKGGRWLFTFGKNNHKLLNEIWLEVLLCLIGEAFGDESDQICGAVINIRRGVDKISVWTSDFKDTNAVMKIGQILKDRTGQKLVYEAHNMLIKPNNQTLHVID